MRLMRMGGRGLDGRVCMISSREGKSRLYGSLERLEWGVLYLYLYCIEALARGCR
jgi:hypothetical protein